MFTNTTTIVGNLTADPELAFTNAGVGYVRFTIASTPRRLNRDTGQWEDSATLFLSASMFRDAASHVAESLTKGTRVVAVGRLRQHTWQTPEGENRHRVEFDVDEIGPSLKFATARVTKATRADAGTAAAAPASDPWAATAGTAFATVTAGGGDQVEPPF